MIEYIVGFFSGILSWYLLIGLCVFGVISEYNERRTLGVIFAVATAFSVISFFNISVRDSIVISIGYFVIGVIWSFWRYRVFLVSRIEHINTCYADNSEQMRQTKMGELAPKYMVGTLVAWIVAWPFSFIGNIISDFVSVVIIKTYMKVYSSSVKKICVKNDINYR